ncbi:hypothetical protein D9M68_935050 [compost metagenome]
MPPASRAVASCGRMMWRSVVRVSAPRSIDASHKRLGRRRRRATTLLCTMTTQKVAWPTTMVQKPGLTSMSLKAESRAMPVTMPGRAIGRISMVVNASLPKKRSRFRAAAVSVPSTIAMTVAIAATASER